MSEYIKLTQINPETVIHIKVRQISTFMEVGYSKTPTISMMGGGFIDVKESIEEVKKLIGITD